MSYLSLHTGDNLFAKATLQSVTYLEVFLPYRLSKRFCCRHLKLSEMHKVNTTRFAPENFNTGTMQREGKVDCILHQSPEVYNNVSLFVG